MQLLFQVVEKNTVNKIPVPIPVSENKSAKTYNNNNTIDMQKEKSIKMINNIFDSEEIIL